MIPLALEHPGTKNYGVKLELPRIINYPFTVLPLLTEYQYVLHGGLWTTGRNGAILGFLLLDDKGRMYIMDTPDNPLIQYGGDIDFRQASLSSEWIADFLMEINREKWPRQTGFWNMPGLNVASMFSWRDAEPSLAIVNDFLKKHPLSIQGDTGRWNEIYRPCFTPNVFCETKLHKLPPFTSEQVLALTTKRIVKKVGADFEYEDSELLFPDGYSVGDLDGIERHLDKLLGTGKYSIISFDRRNEKNIRDPERNPPKAPFLREYAKGKGIPIVILYGDDENAPAYPGLPKGIKQYWQCPECARQLFHKHSSNPGVEYHFHSKNILLFPINLVPNVLTCIIAVPCICVTGIVKSSEPGWYMIGLPTSPLEGVIVGIVEAWNGRPFWNMDVWDFVIE